LVGIILISFSARHKEGTVM